MSDLKERFSGDRYGGASSVAEEVVETGPTHGYSSGGGNTGSNSNVIDKFSFGSNNNAVDFGDLTVARYGPAGHQG